MWARCGAGVTRCVRPFSVLSATARTLALVTSLTSAGQTIPIPTTRDYGPRMEFRVLGSIEVFEEGNGSIQLGGPKQRAVFAHLLLRANHLVPAEVLIDEVWGEEPPETARNALQSYASHLRKALGAERLEGSRSGYRLRAAASELDAERFQSILRDARRLLPIDPSAAVGAFNHALDLWRGPAFADLAGETSLQAEAARLDEQRLGALEDRIEAQLTIGHHGEVTGELEGLTARHPLRERFWEQSMLALYRSGRQGEALAAYQRAREILADELGIDPSPELRKLQERILSQSPDLDQGGEPLRGYRLLERLGEDPFGVVYRATQPNVGRDVAVRVVHEHRANDPAFILRFEPEAQAVAALEHPHVAPVYDYWREPGRAYVVTRFLRGGNLRELIDGSGELPLRAAIRILEQVASALAVAHRRGVAHGAVGASNVYFDEEGNAYLTDFSIGSGESRPVNDLEAFAALASETLGDRVPMSLGEVLRRALDVRAPSDVAPFFAEVVASLGTRADDVLSNVGVEIRNPYKGLRPFLEADTGDFFGREAFVQRLLERLSERGASSRFIAVVGPSGSGKSSVVRAGLVAAIRNGAVPGSDTWFVTEMHPGHHPFEELDSALMRVAVRPPAGVLARLEAGPRGLLEVAEAIVPEHAELLLVVDQFEEAFTLTESEDDRALFLESLRVATADPASRVRVIATLRADFYDRPLRYARMGQLFGSTTEVLSPLTPEELERAIVRPAERSGLQVDRALAPEIAADVSEQPGSLPLVQYALTELYDRRREGRLTIEAYREIGGVGGALAASAEHLYATRQPAGREAVRQIFLRLVALGEGTADTRRRVPLSELTALEVDVSAMESALDTYGRHRLLTFDRDPSTREPTVEVAHEALLEAWERLRGWIDEAREDVRMRRRLSDAAQDWERSGRDPSFLLTGSRLDQLGSWGSSTSLALGLEERGYLTASMTRREDERVRESARFDRERTVERRSVKRLRALVAVLTVAALVAASLTTIAVNRNAMAQRATRLAFARELGAAASMNLDVDRELAVLLALESLQENEGSALPEVEETLRRAGIAVAIDTSSILGEGVGDVDLAPDGNTVAVVGGDGSVGVWDLLTGRRTFVDLPPGRCMVEDCEGVGSASLSDDGSRLATLTYPHTPDGLNVFHVWDLERSREILTVAPTPGLVDEGSVVLSPDGSSLAIGEYKQIRMYAIGTERPVWTLAVPWGGIPELTFTPDARYVFVGGEPLTADFSEGLVDRGPALVDVATGEVETLQPNLGTQGDPVFSADGNRMAFRHLDWRFTVWDVPSRKRIATGPTLWDSGPAYAMSPDGTVVAVARLGSVELWEPDTHERIGSLQDLTGGVKEIEFDSSGSQIATVSTDGTINVRDARTGELLFAPPAEANDVGEISFSEDGSRLIVVYEDGMIGVHAIALNDAIEIARARVTRGLIDEECQQYLHLSSCPMD